ncbi:dethiobiotin synthase [Thalassotalea sp. PLHSN55]|uniref:dethiobiotin synthase n=1 Tax=Thalassotalea sp. PLHSN55 TaxID=3435888 RepID=UPI003F8332F5
MSKTIANKNTRAIFITATDTDAGKTYVARVLVNALVKQNKRVAVYKPISAGCEQVNGQLINEDALALTTLANCQQPIAEVNPIAFLEPIAPHIAANKQGSAITIADIERGYNKLAQRNADVIITEGAGGWRLPLGNNVFLSEFAANKQMDVILVVNMKLGCLNHAMLTYQAILADGLNCIGWVANCQSDMDYLTDNINELKTMITAPCLGVLAFDPDINNAEKHIQSALLEL